MTAPQISEFPGLSPQRVLISSQNVSNFVKTNYRNKRDAFKMFAWP